MARFVESTSLLVCCGFAAGSGSNLSPSSSVAIAMGPSSRRSSTSQVNIGAADVDEVVRPVRISRVLAVVLFPPVM